MKNMFPIKEYSIKDIHLNISSIRFIYLFIYLLLNTILQTIFQNFIIINKDLLRIVIEQLYGIIQYYFL